MCAKCPALEVAAANVSVGLAGEQPKFHENTWRPLGRSEGVSYSITWNTAGDGPVRYSPETQAAAVGSIRQGYRSQREGGNGSKVSV